MLKNLLIISAVTLLLTGCSYVDQAKSDAEETVENLKELNQNIDETTQKLESVNQKLKDLKIAD
jgi:PBP1b-binding outer membrane lipoprotein LpoB